jgi:hypothetical protein
VTISHRTHIQLTQAGYESEAEHLDSSYPEFFGAYGDGIHEDTAAFATALAYNSGGKLQLGANKTYLVQNVTIPTGTMIVGQGWNSMLKLVGGAAAGACVVKTNVDTWFQGLRDLTVDGNKESNSGAYDGVYINGSSRFLLDRVRVKNCKRHGVYANGTAQGYSIQPTLYNTAIDNCDGTGVYVGDYCSDMEMVNLDIGQCGIRGIELRAGNSVMCANTSIWQCPIGLMGWWN